jgi:hypothetical protein
MRTCHVWAGALALLAACGRSAPEAERSAAGALTQSGFTAPTHFGHDQGGLALLADGRALAAAMAGAEIYDAPADVWTPTAPMTAYRAGFTMVRLNDGRVLVAGGYGSSAQTAEIFDPATGVWTATPEMPKPRSRAPAAVLQDGRVLFTTSNPQSGMWVPDADILDPVTSTWTSTAGPSTTACVDGTSFELLDGRYFFACGSKGEVYQPSSGTFIAVQGFLHKYDVGAQLADGRILLAGGYGAACQVFDPATNQLVPTGSMMTPARHDAAVALMADGTVLVAGGNDGTSTLDSVERYDPATGAWVAMPPLLQKREGARMVRLPSGDALIVGGSYTSNGSSYGIAYDRQAELIPGVCIPLTCAAAGASCGPIGDGCGGTLECGVCGGGQVCLSGTCCTPATCASAGASCGNVPDGCGGALDCGSCGADETCTAAHACCAPTTCAAAGAQCGAIADSCGGSLACGTCGPGEVCSGNACVCAPTTCAAQGVPCGILPDGCGGTLTCNACPSGQVCDLASAACKAPPGQATYDDTLRVPACGGETAVCDTGTLVVGRGRVGPEANAPNTLGGACADGASGSFHSDESLDRLRVSTLDGGPFTTGKQVRVEVTVWAYPAAYASDKLDLYYAADAQSPSWTFLTTLTPSAAGAQVLSATYNLPPGARQAVRGVFRYGGSPAPCTTGSYDDHDDVVFPVISIPDTTAPSLTLTAPAPGVTVAGDVPVSATATDEVGVTRVDFLVAPNVVGATPTLIGTDTTAPYSLTWNTRTTPAASSHVLSATAYDGAGNQTTRSMVVVVDNVGPAVSITSPVGGATVSGAVTISADAADFSGIRQVAFYADGALVGAAVVTPYAVTWDATAAAPGGHTLVAVATDTLGNGTTSPSVPVTVSGASSPGVASYSANWGAPACSAVAASCDSGPTLLRGRATLGPEPNAPNTLGASCADGSAGTFHADESIDRLLLATVDGGPLRAGAQVRLTATLWVYSTTDVLDVYAAPSAASPVWTFVGTVTPTASGAQTLAVSYTLPAGSNQAVRAVLRWGGTRSPCPTGSYDDKDDLVFPVQ